MRTLASVKKIDPRLLLVLAALFWSSGGLLIKSITVGPLMTAGLRSLIAGTTLWLLFSPPIFRLRRAEVLGALSYAGTVLCFVMATKWTSAANAILLQSTAPIHVALLGSFYLREKIRGIDWITMLAVFIGMFFFFHGEMSLSGMQGNVMGLVSGFAFACFILVTRKHRDLSTLAMIVVGNFMAALIALPWAFSQGLPTWSDAGMLLVLGVVQLALPYALYTLAITHVTAIDTVLIVLIEPVLNPLWVFLFLGESPGLWSLIGGSIVLGAVTLRSLLRVRKLRGGEIQIE